ncbi:MAG: hypothetical protein RLZZ241_1816 [Bacteroidota bacterium]|jgi:predicted short-subunit dehydrogenase-like oxidoreductase (DUF2520 family)
MITFVVVIQVVIIGSGNVAYHLHRALLDAKGIALLQLVGRNNRSFTGFDSGVPTVCSMAEIVDADLYLVAVSDDAIGVVFEQLQDKKGLIAHTSGGVNYTGKTDTNRFGVFYPLQTFSRTRDINFNSIPILLEAQQSNDLELLKTIAIAIGGIPIPTTSNSRNAIHLAAVFANNFTNHLCYLASEICTENGVDSNLLLPLYKETMSKLEVLSPKAAQTGPAKRGDLKTQEIHSQLLGPGLNLDLYKLLSLSIKKTYEEKL